MPRFGSEEDYASDSRSGGDYVKVGAGTTPIRLLLPEFKFGYVHFMRLPDGSYRKVAAIFETDERGKTLNNGWDKENDPVSAIAGKIFEEAKYAETHGASKEEVQVIKDRAKNYMPKYQAVTVVAVGEMAKDRKTREEFADFDNYKVGVLTMSEAQKMGLRGLINSPEHPSIESVDDLLSRTVYISKEQKNSKWIFDVDDEPSDVQIDWDPTAFDLESGFTPDPEELESLATIIEQIEDTGEMPQGSEDDAALEGDSEEPEEPKTAPPHAVIGARRPLPDFTSSPPWETGKENPYKKPGVGADAHPGVKRQIKVAPVGNQRRGNMAKGPVKKPAGQPAPTKKGGKKGSK